MRSNASDVACVCVHECVSTRDPDCQLNCKPPVFHSIASRTISGHRKLLACWVHSVGGVFSAILKLSIRSRLW